MTNNLSPKQFDPADLSPEALVDRAATMFGTGSKKHLAAIKKYAPKP